MLQLKKCGWTRTYTQDLLHIVQKRPTGPQLKNNFSPYRSTQKYLFQCLFQYRLVTNIYGMLYDQL